MRIVTVVTDYIRRSLLTTHGDLLTRGASMPERLATTTMGRWLRANGAGAVPGWTQDLGGASVKGDLITRGTNICERIAAVAVNRILKSAGTGEKPVWGVDRAELTTEGDLTVRGAAVPERLAGGDTNSWLRGSGAGNKPSYTRALGGINTTGDLIVHGGGYAVALAAVAVGQVLKSAGTSTIPVWAKPSISDLGFKLGMFTRSSNGTKRESGLGFRPKVVIFFCADSSISTQNFSLGVDDGTDHFVIAAGSDMSQTHSVTNWCIYITRDGGNSITATITSVDDDSFTLTFNLTGTCSISVGYLAIG